MAAHYVDNQLFLQTLIEYRQALAHAKSIEAERPRVPEYIGECFLKISHHLAFKANFINYTFRDEMISDGIENCLQYVGNFDPAKSQNPFAYFTQIVYFAFVRRIQKEKRHLHTKYKIIESMDLDAIITQEHDNGEFDNQYIEYLKEQLAGYSYESSVAPKPKRSKTKGGELSFDGA